MKKVTAFYRRVCINKGRGVSAHIFGLPVNPDIKSDFNLISSIGTRKKNMQISKMIFEIIFKIAQNWEIFEESVSVWESFREFRKVLERLGDFCSVGERSRTIGLGF